MRTAWFLVPLVACYAPVGIDGAAPTGGGGDVDTDGDGLVASIEAEIGSDPANPDSDGDGYTDGVEYDGNADVLDPDHHPYAGGWSIDACRTDIVGTGTRVGDVAFDFDLMDQFGETVHLYDFCNRAVYLLFAAFW
jgi:hypothetical protein